MSESWIEVQPGGYLKKYGNHKFYVNTPAEAIKAMLMQVKGFDAAFRAAGKRGVQFAVRTDKRNITNTEQLCMGKPKVVRLIPKYSGGKNGGMTLLAVAAIIAITVFTAGTGTAPALAFLAAGTTAGSIAVSIAISLAIGGITQMLSPQPDGLSSRTDPDNKASYAFGGPVNTAAQGVPVPVFYGYREVGGAVISASLVSEDQQ